MAALSSFSVQTMFVLGIALTQEQNFAIDLVELSKVYISFFWMAFLPSSALTAPCSSMFSANVLRRHSVSLYISPE